MKMLLLFAVALMLRVSGFSQTPGAGTTTSSEKLQLASATKTNSQTVTTGVNRPDFLIESTPGKQGSFKKEHTGLTINYIIALDGGYPSQGAPQVQGPMIGEIKIFTGIQVPYGWAFCQGQLLLVADYPTLFQIIGTTFGGDGRKNFSLPDLRKAVPVGVTSGGYLGERSN